MSPIVTLLLLTGATVGCAVASRALLNFGRRAPTLRPTGRAPSNRKMTRIIYRHTDEILGVRAVLIDERAKNHARVSFWLSPKLAAYIAPRSWAGVPLPSTRRMRHYILEVGDVRPRIVGRRITPWWQVWLARQWNDVRRSLGWAELEIVTETPIEHWVPHRMRFHHTSETAVNADRFLEVLLKGRRRAGGLAQALGLAYEPNMFAVEWNRPHAELIVYLREQVEQPADGDGRPLPATMPHYGPPPTYNGNGQPPSVRRREDVIS